MFWVFVSEEERGFETKQEMKDNLFNYINDTVLKYNSGNCNFLFPNSDPLWRVNKNVRLNVCVTVSFVDFR